MTHSAQEKGGEAVLSEAVQHALFRHPTFARDRYAPAGQVQLLRAVGVRVDAEHAPKFDGAAVPAPVQVQAVRIGIDLSGNPLLSARAEHLLDVDAVTLAPEQQPAR